MFIKSMVIIICIVHMVEEMAYRWRLRSKNIYGPYEQKVVIRDTTPGVNFGIHQGALIKTQSGEWWTILFVDSGPFGRFPSLQPVTWVDDWPMVGVNGKAVITYRKPDVGKITLLKIFQHLMNSIAKRPACNGDGIIILIPQNGRLLKGGDI